MTNQYQKSDSSSNHKFDADEKTINRARRYIEKMPAAIDGQGGHNATFRVACVLTHKFHLGHDDALALMVEYSERCDPPWTTEELEHKVTDALRILEGGTDGESADEQVPGPVEAEKKTTTATLAVGHPDRPQLLGIRPFGSKDVETLAALRRIPRGAIQWAAFRNFLFTVTFHGQECYGVKDSSGRLMEIRRLDGKPFPAIPEKKLWERKSHAIRGSNKRWLLGAMEAREFSSLVLVEGIPDFIYAQHLVLREKKRLKVGVVAMLSAMPAIDTSALIYLHGKTIRIIPHLDKAGLKGADRWKKQLLEAGAKAVDMFDLSGLRRPDGRPVKDLCDLTGFTTEQLNAEPTLNSILP